MKYMGSKARFTKEILPIILKDRKPEQWYVEPFAGGMNVICEVQGNRIANDKNHYLIEMWKGLLENRERPNDIPKQLYDKARTEYNNGTNIEFDDFMIGWIGWMGSFNGRFFDGGYSGKTKTRDYIDEQIRNTLKQVDKLKGTVFTCGDYDAFNIPKNSIIYCDPPYRETKQYSNSKDFNHDKFFEWCREMSKQGHTLFVSEYQVPDDFECVWEMKTKSYLKPSRAEQTIEKLFKFSPTNVQ
jgi:DNA adenine methylase